MIFFSLLLFVFCCLHSRCSDAACARIFCFVFVFSVRGSNDVFLLFSFLFCLHLIRACQTLDAQHSRCSDAACARIFALLFFSASASASASAPSELYFILFIYLLFIYLFIYFLFFFCIFCKRK